MKRFFPRRVVIAVCAVVAILFLLRPSASRLQDRVTRSISAALGRNVEISSLHVRFLPRPGFEFENLIIHDDARFGPEPLVRAPEVTAWLQVGALLRGHIQIARLNLDDPSLNLTRNAAGEWNFADLLQRSSSITVAPTAAGRHTSAKAFPYIEATGARVNFKVGEEKTHFALTDAKFALWQGSENSWGMRLQAQPIRTDASLTDTGQVALNGTWQRSPTLRATPLQFSFEWKRAQLGQVSKLVSGTDRGWRGGIVLSGELAGTPDDLKIAADASVDDFRGPDVLSGNNLRLAARCSASYNWSARAVSNLDCVAPGGDGNLELKGAVTAGLGSAYDLQLLLTDIPAQSILAFARHAKTGLAGNLAADGLTDAKLHFTRVAAGPMRVDGDGEIQQLQLISSSSGTLTIARVPFTVESGTRKADQHRVAPAPNSKSSAVSGLSSAEQPRVELGPFDLSMGKAGSLHLQGALSQSGYEGSVRGDARVRELLQAARIVSIPVPAVNADGNSNLDLAIAGDWGSKPKITGTAQLHSVSAQVLGFERPVIINKASLAIQEDALRVTNLTATAAATIWHGSLRVPRPCATPATCPLQFSLRTAQLSAAELNTYFNPALQKKSWYRFLDLRRDQPPYLLQARANGSIAVENMTLGSATCSHFTAGLRLEEGRVALSNLSGEVLGGVVSGDWEADFNVNPPAYKGSGDAKGLSLAEVSELMHDSWVDGSANAKYDFIASGRNFRDLLDSANFDTTFSITNSSFPHVVLAKSSGPLRAENFFGTLQLQDGEISFRDAKLETSRGVYTVSGTSSLAGVLDLRLAGDGIPGYSVSGTVLQMHVVASPTTAAALKP